MCLGKTREKYKVRSGSQNARAHAETRDDPENGRFGHFSGLGLDFGNQWNGELARRKNVKIICTKRFKMF